MKKTLLLLLAASSLCTVQSSRATISFGATPSSQTVSLGSNFTISISVSVTQNSAPADLRGFDLYLATAAANSGYFTIQSATPGTSFTLDGPPAGADPLSTAAAAGFVRNNVDQGFDGSTVNTPVSNLLLETLTLSIGANVPVGTYTFSTTTSANAGMNYSDVFDSNFAVYQADMPGTFSITVVPEPSTWAMLGFGAVGVGLMTLRRRRAS